MNTPRFYRSHNFASEPYKDGKRRYPFMYRLLVSKFYFSISKYTRVRDLYLQKVSYTTQ